jgi:hypothetical protein
MAELRVHRGGTDPLLKKFNQHRMTDFFAYPTGRQVDTNDRSSQRKEAREVTWLHALPLFVAEVKFSLNIPYY